MRSSRLLLVMLLGVLVGSGCVSSSVIHAESKAKVRKRAAFELDCPADQLVVEPIDSLTVGVEGCGHRLVYVFQTVTDCATGEHYLLTRTGAGLMSSLCTPILNADSRPVPASAPAPATATQPSGAPRLADEPEPPKSTPPPRAGPPPQAVDPW